MFTEASGSYTNDFMRKMLMSKKAVVLNHVSICIIAIKKGK